MCISCHDWYVNGCHFPDLWTSCPDHIIIIMWVLFLDDQKFFLPSLQKGRIVKNSLVKDFILPVSNLFVFFQIKADVHGPTCNVKKKRLVCFKSWSGGAVSSFNIQSRRQKRISALVHCRKKNIWNWMNFNFFHQKKNVIKLTEMHSLSWREEKKEKLL